MRRQYHLPHVLKLAKEILNGNFKKEQVEECGEGYRIKDLVMCENLTMDLIDAEPQRDEARLTLISDLTRLGYRVAMVTPDLKIYESLSPDFVDRAKNAGIGEKDIIKVEAPRGQEKNLPPSFPRDHFSLVGNTLYFNPTSYFDRAGLFSWLRKEVGTSRAFGMYDHSPIGNGGEVVLGNEVAFLGSKITPYMHELPEQMQAVLLEREKDTTKAAKRELQDMGFETFIIPPGWADLLPPPVLSELNTDKRFFISMDHADMHVLFHPQKNGLFFSQAYYREHKALLGQIVEKMKPDIFGVLPEDDGLPINSLVLPNGAVYMDMAAQQSIRILRQAGIEVETTSKPIGTWGWGMQGGIHCATNTISLPIEG